MLAMSGSKLFSGCITHASSIKLTLFISCDLMHSLNGMDIEIGDKFF